MASLGGCGMSGLHESGLAGDPASRVHRLEPGVQKPRPRRVHRLDPRAKIAGLAGITVVGVSTPPRYWPVLAACALALAVIAGLARVGPGVIWSRAKMVLPLVVFVAVFVPFVRGGEKVDVGPLALSRDGLTTFFGVSSKALIGTV